MTSDAPIEADFARTALVITTALIVYGSLYPFDFACGDPGALRQLIAAPPHRGSLTDLLANIALFVPFGLFAALLPSLRSRPVIGAALVLIASALLAALLQASQVCLPSRVPALGDAAWNVTGAAAGVLLAAGFVRVVRYTPIADSWCEPRVRVATTLLMLFLAAELAPLVPTLDLGQLGDALEHLVVTPRWHVLDSAWQGVRLLGAAMILGALLPAQRVLPALGWLAFVVFLGNLFVLGRSADVSLAAGLLGACLAWSALAQRPAQQRRACAALLLVLVYSATALSPFRFEANVRAFNVVPFADLLEGSLRVNLQALLPRLFVFTTLLWLAAPAVRAGAVLLAAWVFLLELAQTGLSGRTPSVTDALCVLLVGTLLARAMKALPGNTPFTTTTPYGEALTRTTTPATSPLRAACAAALSIAAIAAALWLLVRLPGVPYNVRELLRDNASLAASSATALALLWIGAGGALLGGMLSGNHRPWLLLPLGTLVSATLGLAIMLLGVTSESIADVVGSNNLYWFVTRQDLWGPWWRESFLALPDPLWVSLIERPVRYTALVGPLFIALAIAHAALAGGGVHWNRTARLLAWALPWLWLCKAIAFDWSSTDNLNELIARDGPWGLGGGGYLYGLLVLVASSAALLARTRGWRLPATTAMLLLTLPLSWWLATHGFAERVIKYGLEFPALQFVVGPDRGTTLATVTLALRWMFLHAAAVVVFALGMRLAELVVNSRHPAAATDDQRGARAVA